MTKATRIETRGNHASLVLDNGVKIPAAFTGPAFVLRPPIEVVYSNVPDTPGGPGGITVGPIPDSVTGKAVDGTTVTFNKTQLTHAANIIRSAAPVAGVTRPVLVIALITAIVESVLYMYANSSTYPSSVNYPHDKDGQDHDSLGLFQQRPQSGWGSIAQLMDTAYSTTAFLGGPSGPNGGSPPGLFDKADWQSKTPGQAAQSVQVSAHPERYDNVVPLANAILDALLVSGGESGDGWAWPFQYSRYVLSDPRAQFGMRVNPVTGLTALHKGLDFGGAGIAGQDIPAACAGTVTVNNFDTRGNNVTVDHGNGLATNYFHMRDAPSVNTGDRVAQGQKLGVVGTTGNSTGEHLHWETIVNGEAVNPRDFMKARGVPES
jgi:murein DD-endopeptidase MepM/ murein hydrolase activator NlpD